MGWIVPPKDAGNFLPPHCDVPGLVYQCDLSGKVWESQMTMINVVAWIDITGTQRAERIIALQASRQVA